MSYTRLALTTTGTTTTLSYSSSASYCTRSQSRVVASSSVQACSPVNSNYHSCVVLAPTPDVEVQNVTMVMLQQMISCEVERRSRETQRERIETEEREERERKEIEEREERERKETEEREARERKEKKERSMKDERKKTDRIG